nr:unnamed protein product [Digitaria exilis]
MAKPHGGSPAAPVTGDRYLDLLVRFVARNAGALLDGTVTLRLHPVGLHYVASRLEALRELEAVGAGAPVDYLRAYVADLGDHRALEQLRRILRLLTSLKVVAAGPARDPAPLSLLPFARLRVLELRGCDLSTSPARGLLELRHTLEKLVCYDSTLNFMILQDALRHVFTSRIMDIKDSPVWSKLSYVSCASNDIVLMDESLQLLPAIETLDLSRNKFAKVDNLWKCTKLRNLDLGFNHLRSISSLSEVSSRIVKLVVRNNALTTVHGIENLKSLMGLDLSYNIISNFSELEILGTLSLLQNLWLEGNPICCARWYRAHVFSFFRNPENLRLDDKGMNTQEYWEKQVLFARRQNQPAGYGFYFPAIDDHEDEDTLTSKMRKISRLASIVDGERNLCDDGVEQQSTPCDSDSSKKDEVAAADHDIKIASLINTVELLKKEKSSDWLREFKEWMDDNAEKIEGENLSPDFTSGNGRDVALLRSSQNKLYVLLLDMFCDEKENMPRVLDSYTLGSLKMVSVGLGLQVLRVHMVDDAAHLFFTRTSKEAQDVLWLLSVTNSPKLNHELHLQSWENIQVELFEKCICGSAKTGIFFYSMFMFWRNDAEEDSLFIRSIIVTEGSILVCIEDLDQFGGVPDDSDPPYFYLDASCSIRNVLEVESL